MPLIAQTLGKKKTVQMLDNILKECETSWIKTKTNKNHPFRYFTLATTSPNGKPQARTVVLRKFDAKAFTFGIYTDARTPKIAALQHLAEATLLFYDHRKLCQIRVNATCIAQRKDATLFAQQHEGAQKDYTTTVAPGTAIKAMDAIDYEKDNHFMVLVFKAYQIDYLRLKRPNHQRAIFTLDGNDWQGTFVAP